MSEETTEEAKGIETELPIKGFLMWFECSAGGLTETKAQELCNRHSIPFEAFPKLTKKKAFVTAIRDLERGGSGLIATQITSVNEDHLMYAIMEATNKQSNFDRTAQTVDGSVSYDQNNVLVYDRQSQEVFYKFQDDVMKEKVAKYLGTYTTSDIRRMIIKVFDDAFVEQMRKNGGIYFAPNSDATKEMIGNLGSLLEDIPGDCHLHYSEVLDSAHIKASLLYYMKDRILGEVRELKDHIENIDLERRRAYLMMQMRDRFKAMEEKINVYDTCFELVTETLKEEMLDVKEALLKRMDD